MRIAIVTPKLIKGDGIARVNYELALHASEQGCGVVLLSSEVAPELLSKSNISWIRIPYPTKVTRLFANLFFAYLSTKHLNKLRSKIDIIQLNGFVTWRPGDINTAHFVHGAWLQSAMHPWRLAKNLKGIYHWIYNSLNAYLEKKAFQRAKTVVAVSFLVKEQLQSTYGISKDIQVIHNGVDLEEFIPAQARRAQLGLPEAVPLLLFAGGIKTPRKNLDTILQALLQIPLAHLVVLGDTDGSSYPDYAKQLGVANRTHFLGFQSNVAAIMQSVDIFVFPSRYEACSLVLLEALASGLPIITAKTAGGAEIVTSDCGIVLPDPEDRQALVDAISMLVSNPLVRQNMGLTARLLAQNYSWQNMGKEYIKLYTEQFSKTK